VCVLSGCGFCRIVSMVCFLHLIPVFADSYTLQWRENSEDDLSGYRVYWGQHSGTYTSSVDVGKKTSYILDDIREDTPYYIAVTALDYWGNESRFSREVKILSGQVLDLPDKIELSENYPNPFNPGTSFDLSLPSDTSVEMVLYNSVGQKIRTLVSEKYQAGYHVVSWDGFDENGQQVSAGVYYCRIFLGNKMLMRRLLLLR
jgi:hypothetical protein